MCVTDHGEVHDPLKLEITFPWSPDQSQARWSQRWSILALFFFFFEILRKPTSPFLLLISEEACGHKSPDLRERERKSDPESRGEEWRDLDHFIQVCLKPNLPLYCVVT